MCSHACRIHTGFIQATTDFNVLVIMLLLLQQAVGASGAAALRPGLQKAANKGVESVRRTVLMSAEQSKQTLCVALLREVKPCAGRISSSYGYL